MEHASADRFTGIQYVFLDRDGVLNRKPAEDKFISRWSDLEVLPGVEAAIAQLNRCGCTVIVVTNQRGIALGRYTEQDLANLHQKLRAHLSMHGAHLNAMYYCPHDRDQCSCRKPKPGMFEQAFRDFPKAKSSNSILIGDSISDIQAGEDLGMKTIFIEGDPLFQKPGADRAAKMATLVSPSLYAAVFQVLAPALACKS